MIWGIKFMRGRLKNKIFVYGIVLILLLTGLTSVYASSLSKNILNNISKNINISDKETIFEPVNKRDSINNKVNLSKFQLIRNRMFDDDRRFPTGFPQRKSVTIDGEDWDIVVPDDYDTIQAAVKAVGPEEGYRIFVRSGTYNENIIIEIDGVILHGENKDNTIIDGSMNGHVIILDSSYNNISGFLIQNSGLEHAGIYFDVSSGNHIFDCKIIENHNGQHLYHSHANNIINNIISENKNNGVIIEYSCLANTISNNQLEGNAYCGVLVDTVSRCNLIAGNMIDSGSIGVKILGKSENNMVHHNKFIGNNQNAFDNSENRWDDNINEGNYWDDYNGTDSDGDGIGDIPYSIHGGDNKDRYPLMSPPIIRFYNIDESNCENQKYSSIETSVYSYSSGKTIIVPDDYSTIQEAINHSYDGDIIQVKAGIYYENVVVDKSVSIIGEDKDETIVDGSGSGHIFEVITYDVQILGFTIQHTNLGSAGVKIKSNNFMIKDNVIKECGDGICLYFSSGSIIENNSIRDNSFGIYLDTANNCKINNNRIIKNEDGIGFWMSSNLKIKNNNLENNSVTGILYLWSNKNIFDNNNISYNSDIGFQLFNSDKNIIKGNTLDNNIGDGIAFQKSKDNKILRCIFTDNNNGVSLRFYSDNNTISGNNINNNYCGIGLFSTCYTIIQGNNITGNNQNGILIDSSSDNHIANSIFNKNEIGVSLQDSKYNTIENSTFIFNHFGGIYCNGGKHNIFKKNNFIDNNEETKNIHYFGWYGDKNFFFKNYWSGRIIKLPLPYLVQINMKTFNLPIPHIRLTFNWDWFPSSYPYDFNYGD
jgi:parallel beta-helix repeat protein